MEVSQLLAADIPPSVPSLPLLSVKDPDPDAPFEQSQHPHNKTTTMRRIKTTITTIIIMVEVCIFWSLRNRKNNYKGIF